MKAIAIAVGIILCLIGCKKDVQTTDVKNRNVKNEKPDHQNGGSRNDCNFYTQGIHSLEEFDEMVEAEVYPLSLMTPEAVNDFRENLKFANPDWGAGTVVVGYKRGLAFEELDLESYIELIQLIVGINPLGDFYKEYSINESLPEYVCTFNMTPCYNESPPCTCKVYYDQECCFIRVGDILSNCE